MADKLTLNTIPKTSISGLTYDNIIQDIYNLIQDNSLTSENWTDFVSSDAGRMLSELFAWITSQLANRIDNVGNELFIDTVQRKENLLRLLKLVGYRLEFPTAASVKTSVYVQGTDGATADTTVLSEGILKSGASYLSFSGSSFKGIYNPASGRTFEFINFNEATNTYDYISSVSINTKRANEIVLYEGKTSCLQVTTTVSDRMTYVLDGPVIKNSVSVYYTVLNEADVVELVKVDNFFSRVAQTSDIPVYKVNNLGNGTCQVEFPQKGITKFSVPLNTALTIMYRVGGGTAGNISVGSLNTVEEIFINNGKKKTFINYKNIEAGIGGRNEEDIETIRKNVPQEVRNTIAAITAEDYEYILEKENSDIIDVKAYGENNIDANEVAAKYGYYVSPLDVWLLIIKELPNFSMDIPNITDYINDICFEIFDLNERLNEVYQINIASMNQKIDWGNYIKNPVQYINGETIVNYITVDASADISDKMKDTTADRSNYRVVVTNTEFNDREQNSVIGENTDYVYNKDSADIADRYISFVDGQPTAIVEKLYAGFENPVNAKHIPATSQSTLEFNFAEELIVSSFQDADTVVVRFENKDYTPQEICQIVNDNIAVHFSTGIQSVVLKEDITQLNSPINSTATSGVTNFTITDTDGTTTFTLDITNSTTWNELVSLINTAFTENSITSLKATLRTRSLASEDGTVEPCYDIMIIRTSTSYSSFTIAPTSGGVINFFTFIGQDATSITSSVSPINAEQYELVDIDLLEFMRWDDVNKKFIVSYWKKGLPFRVRKTSVGFESIVLGIDDDEFNTYGNSSNLLYFLCNGERSFRFSDINTFSSYTISFSNMKEKFESSSIYVSGFFGTKNENLLGSYYATIDTNEDVGINSEIRALLKRYPIRNLYNTKYQETTRGSGTLIVDDYNSDYQIKFTRNKTNFVFNQIGKIESKPYIRFGFDINIPVIQEITVSNRMLYLKADGNGPDFPVDTTWDVEFEDGHKETEVGRIDAVTKAGVIDISKLQGSSITYLITLLENMFGSRITTITQSGVKILQSNTNYYYSCLDITGTNDTLAQNLFVIPVYGQTKFYSDGMYIPATKIEYQKFSLTEGTHRVNETIAIAVDDTISSVSADINTGADFDSFIANIKKSAVANKVNIINNNQIFMISRTPNSKIRITLYGKSNVADTTTEEEGKVIAYNKIVNVMKMFYDFENVVPTYDGIVDNMYSYSAFIEKTTSGDYYVKRDDEGMKLVIENTVVFPTGDIYVHMIEDYRGDHIVVDGEENNSPVYTDEYKWEQSIKDKKMLCVNHVYKQPQFLPFDIEITANIYTNVGLNKKEIYRNQITQYIKNNYNVYTSQVGKSIYKNDIAIELKRGISGISDVVVDYLGYDLRNKSDDSAYLNAEFNEKLVVAYTETETITNNEGGSQTLETVYIHGIKVNIFYGD